MKKHTQPISQLITNNSEVPLSDTEAVYAQEYMEEVLLFTAHFVQDSVISLLSNLLPDMIVRKSPDGTWNYYSGTKKIDKQQLK